MEKLILIPFLLLGGKVKSSEVQMIFTGKVIEDLNTESGLSIKVRNCRIPISIKEVDDLKIQKGQRVEFEFENARKCELKKGTIKN